MHEFISGVMLGMLIIIISAILLKLIFNDEKSIEDEVYQYISDNRPDIEELELAFPDCSYEYLRDILIYYHLNN